VKQEGSGLIAVDTWATAAWAVLCVLAAVLTGVLNLVVAITSLVLFLVGIVAFLWSFWLAVQRSREDLMGIGGLYFLADSAPRPVQVRLMGLFGLQCVVSLGVAIAHPFTALAFATLVPLFGLGMAGLWGARHGTFPPRPDGAA
jgi:hypothetical protein